MASFVSIKSLLVKFSNLVNYNLKISVNHGIDQQIVIENSQNNKINEILHWTCYVILAAGFLFLMSAKSHAGIVSSWLGTSSSQESIHNPCSDGDFRQQYGKYCSGFLKKEIRCLSDGKSPGVCDSAAVCDAGQSVTKQLCEKHCLNTSPQKLGNQYIQISCTPRTSQEQNAASTDSIPAEPLINGDENNSEEENSSEAVHEVYIRNDQSEIVGDQPVDITLENQSTLSSQKESSLNKESPAVPSFFEAYPGNIRHYFWGAPD